MIDVLQNSKNLNTPVSSAVNQPAVSVAPPSVPPITSIQSTNPELAEDNKKKKIIAISIIVAAFLILFGLIYFMFLASVPSEPVAVVEETPTQEQLPQTPIIVEPKQKLSAKTEATEEDLKRLAASFIERYGTYSNQSGYNNITDLNLFMSRSLRAWADNFIAQRNNEIEDNSIYYGITTKSVVIETVDFDDLSGTAVFSIKTQRQEAVGGPNNIRSFQQDAEVEMLKESGVWKVNKVNWGE